MGIEDVVRHTTQGGKPTFMVKIKSFLKATTHTVYKRLKIKYITFLYFKTFNSRGEGPGLNRGINPKFRSSIGVSSTSPRIQIIPSPNLEVKFKVPNSIMDLWKIQSILLSRVSACFRRVRRTRA